MPKAIVLTSILIAAALSGCVTNLDDGPATGAGDLKSRIVGGSAALFLSKSIITFDVEKTRKAPVEIQVEARDAPGNPTPFVVNGTSECVSVDQRGSVIRATAIEAPCTATYKVEVPATGMTRDLTIRIEDPMTMDLGDGLRLRYWNKFVQSGTLGYLRLLDPTNVPAGYHSLGTITLTEELTATNGGRQIAILLKDTENRSLLAAPTGYSNIFEGGGTAWLPVCPDDYVALGVVIVPTAAKPSVDHVRCVHTDYTVPGTLGDIRYSHVKDGWDLHLRSIENPPALESGERRMPLPSHTYVPCGDHTEDSCRYSGAVLNKLLMPADVVERVDNTDMDIQLVGPQPMIGDIPRFHAGVRMPFTLVPGAMSLTDRAGVIERSPFYTVYRTESFNTLEGGIIDNRQGAEPVVKEYSITTGYEEEETTGFSKTVGVSITISAGGSVGGFGGGVESTFSYEFTHSRESKYSYSQESTSSTTFTIPAGAYAQIVQVSTEWIAKNSAGEFLKGGKADAGAQVIKYLQFPLPA